MAGGVHLATTDVKMPTMTQIRDMNESDEGRAMDASALRWITRMVGSRSLPLEAFYELITCLGLDERLPFMQEFKQHCEDQGDLSDDELPTVFAVWLQARIDKKKGSVNDDGR